MSSHSSLETSSFRMGIYCESSSTLKDIDSESSSPVLVNPSPPPDQNLPPPTVDQRTEPSMESLAGPPAGDGQCLQDSLDVIRELTKPESTSSDCGRPVEVTSPTFAIPSCWIPIPEPEGRPHRGTSALSSPSSPSIVPPRPPIPIHSRPLSPYQTSRRSESPDMEPIIPPRMSTNPTIIQVPLPCRFGTPSDSPSRASLSPAWQSPIPQAVPGGVSGWAGMRAQPAMAPAPSSSPSQSTFHIPPPAPPIILGTPQHYKLPMPQLIPPTSRLSYRGPELPTSARRVITQPIHEVVHRFHSPPTSPASSEAYSSIRYSSIPVISPHRCCLVSPVCDDELWFEDGNITLHTSAIEFRVYKGPLLALSPVLKAMCKGSRNASYPTSLGLSDTSPEDLRHVLRFLYGGTSRIEPSFSEISAHIRFGYNYEAERLLQRSVDYLKKFYVTELDTWLQLPSLDPPFFEPVHAIGVVNLARLLGKDGEAVLPIALMRCCTLGAQVLEGFIREDGTKETLSSGDLGRCFEGKVKLLEASVRAAETLRADMTTDECSRPRRCKDALARFVNELLGSEDSTLAGSNGDSTLANELRCLRWDLSFSLSSRRAYLQTAGADVAADEERELCPKCFVRQVEEQRKIFEKLPQMMGVSVEGWATKVSSAAA